MKNSKHGFLNALHNTNDDDGGWWAPCDSDGNVIWRETKHIEAGQDHPQDGREWVIVRFYRESK